MKIAILWGTVFGIVQALMSVVAGISLSSPSALALSCIGTLLSIALALACGLIAAIHAKAFVPGFGAGIIATAISVLASLILIVVKPSILDLGTSTMVVSFAIFIAYGVILGAVGSGIGLFISRQLMEPTQTKA